MARSAHPQQQQWSSQPTRETYKDLLIFEERLKQNAERLQAQRRKYEAFLSSLVLTIVWLSYDVMIRPSLYSLVHYVQATLLIIALVTLGLFFAAGMYSDKIGYAYKFVPQANRALRPFNIYLNTRTRSSFSTFTHYLSSFLPPPPPAPHHPSPPPLAVTSAIASSTDDAPISTTQSRRLSSSSTSSFRSNLGKSPPGSPSARPVDAHTASSSPSASASFSSASPRGVPLSPIPPANNPRGELIFSSRVSASFREGYERYRAEWERRRTITLATSVYLATPLRSVTWIRRIVVWRKSESTMTTATVVRVVSSAEEKEGASEKTTQMVGSFPRGEEDRGRDRLRETSSVRVGDERSDAAGGREGNDHG